MKIIHDHYPYTIRKTELITKELLWSIMTTKGTANISIGGIDGILHSIERADGSGNFFNIIIVTKDCLKCISVRTR